MYEENYGISKKVFAIGIILSIVCSLSLSIVFSVGPQGEIGLQGPQGEQGIQGIRGPQGIQGVTGPQGEQGPKGDDGSLGPMGTAGGFGNPDYDSGWVHLAIGDYTDFKHNLGQEDDLFVYIIGRYYYEEYYWYCQDSYYITWITLDEDTLTVFRLNEDSFYEQARVLIWKIEDKSHMSELYHNK